MAKYSILVLNGPNLGRLGERQPEIYGSRGMDDVPALVRQVLGAADDDVEMVMDQHNSEGALIDRLEQARDQGVDGVVINAGAYTHTSLALGDCLAWIGIPAVEVHLSNVLARSEQRHTSRIAGSCLGVISGFGLESYALGVLALYRHLESKK